MKNFNSELDDFKTVSYGIKIKSKLNQRISNHMRALKHLEGKGYSKKRWIQEAIKEQLEEYKNIDLEQIQGDCNLNFTISLYMNDEVVKIVNLLKKLKIRISKTEFFLQAILAKLKREEGSVRNLFQSILKEASEPSSRKVEY